MKTYPTREEMIRELINADVEAELDNGDGDMLAGLLMYGCRGYVDMNDEEIEKEWDEFHGRD